MLKHLGIVILLLTGFGFSKVNAVELKEVECLAKNLYHEARGEPYEGIMAVATVTLNRVRSNDFPDTICEVVKQKNFKHGRYVCQFSWYCERNLKEKRPGREAYSRMVAYALHAIYERHTPPYYLRDSLYYHAVYVNPRWHHLKKVATIGNHIFYKPKNG